jgi:uncharacterized membrane protein YphA (DoxX/SURF4 family)
MNRRTIAFWVVTPLVCFAFVFSGIANLAHFPNIVRGMAHLGYPAYFSTILGVWKVLGALCVAAPGLLRPKEWAYAGMIFDLTGAVISRIVVGDGAPGVIPPLLVALLVAASWALRPDARTLLGRVPNPTGAPA